jgi:hypothetical protein
MSGNGVACLFVGSAFFRSLASSIFFGADLVSRFMARLLVGRWFALDGCELALAADFLGTWLFTFWPSAIFLGISGAFWRFLFAARSGCGSRFGWVGLVVWALTFTFTFALLVAGTIVTRWLRHAVLGGVSRGTVCSKGWATWGGDLEARSPVAWRSGLSCGLFLAQLVKIKKAVVVGALFLVAETFVGLLDAVKLFLLLLLEGRVGDLVGMTLEHQLAVGCLDGGGSSGPVEAEGLVVVGGWI